MWKCPFESLKCVPYSYPNVNVLLKNDQTQKIYDLTSNGLFIYDSNRDTWTKDNTMDQLNKNFSFMTEDPSAINSKTNKL